MSHIKLGEEGFIYEVELSSNYMKGFFWASMTEKILGGQLPIISRGKKEICNKTLGETFKQVIGTLHHSNIILMI